MARWITMAIYGLIVIVLWVKKGQTPGFKAYDLILIDDKTKKTPEIRFSITNKEMIRVNYDWDQSAVQKCGYKRLNL